MGEQWKDVPGYEGLYQCNALGQVRSLARTVLDSCGRVRTIPNKLLKPFKDHQGYLLVGLCHSGKVSNISVHRIVASAFIPNPNKLPQVNHIDCNKENNNVENLEWVTAKENTYHAYLHNLNPIPMVGIYAKNLKTGIVTSYPSIKSFENATGSSSAQQCLMRGTVCNGYHLFHSDPDKATIQAAKISKKQPIGGNTPIKVLCIETGQEFESIRKCGQYFHIDDEIIRSAVRYSTGFVKKLKLTFVIKEDV